MRILMRTTHEMAILDRQSRQVAGPYAYDARGLAGMQLRKPKLSILRTHRSPQRLHRCKQPGLERLRAVGPGKVTLLLILCETIASRHLNGLNASRQLVDIGEFTKDNGAVLDLRTDASVSASCEGQEQLAQLGMAQKSRDEILQRSFAGG